MIQKSSIATVSAAVIALGTSIVSIVPAAAASITFDVEATVSGETFIDSSFADLVNNVLGTPLLASGNFPFDQSLSYSFTIDDDPEQYLDGDVSLGLDLLYSNFGIGFDNTTLSYLDDVLNIDVSGSGILSNGSEQLNFNLGYNSSENEIMATFIDFDPNNNFIDSCLVGSCTTTGNLNLSFLSTAFPGLEFASANGNFSVTTTPESVTTTPVNSVPEPTTVLGLLGVGSLIAARRKGAGGA